LVCAKTGDGVIIDPGGSTSKVLAEVDQIKKELGVPVNFKYLIFTHAHVDHAGAARSIRDGLDQSVEPQVLLHKGDDAIYPTMGMQSNFFKIPMDEPLEIDFYVEDAQTLVFGELKLTVLHTPGHSPGGASFHFESGNNNVLFTGDTLFQASIGRTDIIGGNTKTILKSIKEKLFVFDDNTLVYPGHGPETTIGAEKKQNPFLR